MNERGTSYLEVTITCMLLAIFAGLGITSLSGFQRAADLKAAGQIMVSDLNRARIRAISSNLPVSIIVRPDRLAYAVQETGDAIEWRVFPTGVQFATAPARPVVFYSRGGAAPAGSFTVANSSGRIRIVVSVSGRVRWEIG